MCVKFYKYPTLIIQHFNLIIHLITLNIKLEILNFFDPKTYKFFKIVNKKLGLCKLDKRHVNDERP